MIDFSAVPLVALSEGTKELVSSMLNPVKCIPTDDGFLRDWRGLYSLAQSEGHLSGKTVPNFSQRPDPTGALLNFMQEKAQGLTIKDLLTLLETLDRWDVIDDTISDMEKDAEAYAKGVENSRTSAEIIENDIDKNMLTIGDLHRHGQGQGKQNYDAFLLFSDEDSDFAEQVVEQLENKWSLKLCLKDRDLIAGVTFEHAAVMKLISERCNRLVVIVSPNFLKSPANEFLLIYAQAVGIGNRQRKVIPCLYQKCQLPPEISYYFVLDYNRAGKFYDFWEKLRDSVQAPATTKVHCKSEILQIEAQPEEKEHKEIPVCSTNTDYSNKSNILEVSPAPKKKLSTLQNIKKLRLFKSGKVTAGKGQTTASNGQVTASNEQPEKNIQSLELRLPSLDNLEQFDSSLSVPNTMERKRRKTLMNKITNTVRSVVMKS